jgi:predicted kinase
MLVVLSGLPGVGKTTIARELAVVMNAVHVRIDSIEQALRHAGWTVDSEGYRVAYAVAEDNLRVGRTVIADCVNPWPVTRSEWQAVATRAGVVPSMWNSCARTLRSTDAASSHARRISQATGCRHGRRWSSETTVRGIANGW